MLGRMNNNGKMIKVVSLALSIYMALSPVVVYAEEMENVDNTSVQNEICDEAANCVIEAVENDVITEEQVIFNEVVEEQVNELADGDIDISDIEVSNPLDNDTLTLVENEINGIQDEVIKEATEAIVNVDMTDVNDALNTVSELVKETVTDETVADEIVATADALILVYDAQSNAALEVLENISNESEAVTILEDGSVSVDWNMATEEVKDLYNEYKGALEAKSVAESVKEEALNNQKSTSDKVDEINTNVINKNKEINDKISESKLNKNDEINSIIDKIAADNNGTLEIGKTIDQKIEGSNDIYRFFVNTVEDGIIYGCLTYYDSANKTILRKNFSISVDGEVDHEYIPKNEWVKGNVGAKAIFGNGGNYIVAYVDDKKKSTYIKGNELQGVNISTLMRTNIELNNSIDDRNNALNDLKSIEEIIKTAEENIVAASEKAETALEEYKKTVAMYKTVASLENEIRKNEVEAAMLEYVKAEVEVFKKQQVLDQIEEVVDDSNTTETPENDKEATDIVVQEKTEIKEETKPADQERVETIIQKNDETLEQEKIEELVENIANNLGVEPETVENLVVQTIIDTEDSYFARINDSESSAVEEPVAQATTGSVVAVNNVDSAVVEDAVSQTTTDSVAAMNSAEPVVAKEPVSQAIVDTEDSHIDTTINDEEAVVAGARRSEAKEVAKKDINTQSETQNIVTIDENKVPLANVGEETGYSINWWLVLIFTFTFVSWMVFVAVKKNQDKEEA